MITTKSKSELELMRHAGRIVAEVHRDMREMIRPGVTTGELDAYAEAKIRAAGALPTFKGYNGFPATLCTSINEQVVHGIPSKNTKLKEGDIIGIDCGATYRGYVGDSAWTYAVGEISPVLKKLLEDTEESLWRGINAARVGNRVSDIGAAVEAYIAPRGYGIVRDFCGHGVGTRLHEDPQVPNYGQPGKGLRLRAGWCLAIEPMINLGVETTRTLKDKWTVVTTDGKASAHFEHSLAITPEGPLILTALTDELAFRFLSDKAA
jgi:methionyl aminopeptidase